MGINNTHPLVFYVPLSYHLSQLASSSQCLTQQPPQPQPQEQGEPSTATVPDAVELPQAATTDSPVEEQEAVNESPIEGLLSSEQPQEEQEVEKETADVVTNATSSTDNSHPMTISTTCTSSSSTHNTVTASADNNVAKSEGAQNSSNNTTSSTNSVAGRPVVHKTFNRYHNPQGDTRSHSTSTASPSNPSGGYHPVHAVGQSQYIAQAPPRAEDQMQSEISMATLNVEICTN